MTEAELKRIKAQIIAQKTFEKDNIMGQAMEIGLLETLGIGWQASGTYVDRINAVTPAQIQDVASRYFTGLSMTEARLVPNQ